MAALSVHESWRDVNLEIGLRLEGFRRPQLAKRAGYNISRAPVWLGVIEREQHPTTAA
jgi:hypothetical protein